MILILGKSTLSNYLKLELDGCVVAGKPEFDFAKQSDCDRLIATYPDPDCVINTMGVLSDDIWINLTTNFVAPSYITMKYLSGRTCHVINISSASAWWPSYPGLEFSRFSYNLAKESLSSLGRHINRILVDDPNKLLTTIEPGKFESPMSGFTGQDPKKVSQCVSDAVKCKLHHISVIK